MSGPSRHREASTIGGELSRHSSPPDCPWRNLSLHWHSRKATETDSLYLKLDHISHLCMCWKCRPAQCCCLGAGEGLQFFSWFKPKSSIWVEQKEEHDLKSILLVWWRSEDSHSAPRARGAREGRAGDELGQWAKAASLPGELCRRLRGVAQPQGCPGSLDRRTLCHTDDPRDRAPEAPVSFKETLSPHELHSLKDVKTEDLLRWTDGQEQKLPSPSWLPSKANFFY